MIDDLTSEVDGDRLTLDADRSFGSTGDVRYELVLPDARQLEVSGPGRIGVEGPSAVTDLRLSGPARPT